MSARRARRARCTTPTKDHFMPPTTGLRLGAAAESPGLGPGAFRPRSIQAHRDPVPARRTPALPGNRQGRAGSRAAGRRRAQGTEVQAGRYRHQPAGARGDRGRCSGCCAGTCRCRSGHDRDLRRVCIRCTTSTARGHAPSHTSAKTPQPASIPARAPPPLPWESNFHLPWSYYRKVGVKRVLKA